MVHQWLKELIWHCTVLYLDRDEAVNYDYIVTNSLCYLAQDVFLMAHTLLKTLTLTLDISDILVYRVGLSDSMLKSGSFSIFAKVSRAKFDTGNLRERVVGGGRRNE